MKNIQTYIKLGCVIFLSSLISCNNFDDINSNPDATTEVSASMLCTNIVLNVTRYSGRDSKAFITESALSKYLGYANEGQLSEQYNRIGRSSFSMMTILPNIDQMIKYAEGSIYENSYKGVGSFARAYTFFKLSMEMGDIPHSEANKGKEGIYKPKYDRQEEIFVNILNDLKDADRYFAEGREFTGDPTPYNGDPVKWRKATNAFSLKVLMLLSKKESEASLEVKKRFSDIVQSGNLMDATTGYFGLKYSSINKHPVSGTNDQFTSRTVISTLLIDNLKALNDRRMFYFTEPAQAQIFAGKKADDVDAYIGVDVSTDYSTMNAGHRAGQYSLLNLRYLKEDACEPRLLLTFAEQQLILAEARILGWINTGNAQDYYESGVKAALTSMMENANAAFAHEKAIDQSYIDNYFTGEAAFKATTAEQLKQIWMQRYILNFMQDAPTSFFEYRRNKYPEFPINPETSLNENNKNGIPMRWLYPSNESTRNRDNLEEALNRQYEGYDEINKLMWLLK
jgi:hypothetical protein